MHIILVRVQLTFSNIVLRYRVDVALRDTRNHKIRLNSKCSRLSARFRRKFYDRPVPNYCAFRNINSLFSGDTSQQFISRSERERKR